MASKNCGPFIDLVTLTDFCVSLILCTFTLTLLLVLIGLKNLDFLTLPGVDDVTAPGGGLNIGALWDLLEGVLADDRTDFFILEISMWFRADIAARWSSMFFLWSSICFFNKYAGLYGI